MAVAIIVATVASSPPPLRMSLVAETFFRSINSKIMGAPTFAFFSHVGGNRRCTCCVGHRMDRKVPLRVVLSTCVKCIRDVCVYRDGGRDSVKEQNLEKGMSGFTYE